MSARAIELSADREASGHSLTTPEMIRMALRAHESTLAAVVFLTELEARVDARIDAALYLARPRGNE